MTQSNYKTTFVRTSSNAKTGPIPVTTTERKSCPDACPLKNNGCYADLGMVGMHWRRVESTGIDWDVMISNIKALPNGQLWRHNVAGDLPMLEGTQNIDADMVNQLIKANEGKNGFTYTHHALSNATNRAIVSKANSSGFTINLSANSLDHADQLRALGIGPVVTIVPIGHPKLSYTPNGHVVVVCPAVTSDTMDCATCKLCAKVDRKTIIAFPVHGARKTKAHKVFTLHSVKV